MIKDFLKENKFNFIAIAIFLVVSCVYFSPALQGFDIKQGDIQSYSGMSKEARDFRELYNQEPLWTATSFSGMPAYQISVFYTNPIKEIYNWLALIMTFPIFAIFCAFLSFYILAKSFKVDNYVSILGALAYGLTTYNVLIIEAGHTSKMMAIAYIPGVLGGFIMLYRREKWLLPFLVFTLFFILELLVNHIQMTYYFAFAMFVVGVTEFIRLFKMNQLTLFLKRTGLVFAAIVIALLANFGNYYNTYRFAKKTMRGAPVITISPEGQMDSKENQSSGLDRDYIVQWSYGKAETWNLLIPTAKGDRTVPDKMFSKLQENPQIYNYVAQNYQQSGGKVFGYYWGDQPFTSGPNYLGAIVVFLALLYLFFVQSPLKWGFLVLSGLIFMLSWGKNLGGSVENMWFTNFFIDYVPLYSKFRAVSSILVVINLIAPLMAVLFLHHIITNYEWAKENLKKISIASGVIVLLLVIVAINPSIVGLTSEVEQMQLNTLSTNYMKSPSGVNPMAAYDEVVRIRGSIFASDAWRTIGLIVLAFGFLILFLYDKKYKVISLLGIIVLTVFDLWNVDTRYLNNEKNPRNPTEYIAWEKVTGFENTFSATPGDIAIYENEVSKNPEIQNQVNIRLQEASKKEGLSKERKESIMFSTLNLNTNYRVVDLDNPFNSARASYFHKNIGGYSPAKLKRYQDIIDFYIQKELGYLNTRQFDKMKVVNMLNNTYYLYQGQLLMQNPYAYGNAWFVDSIHWVKDNNAEILAIENTDVSHVAIIHNEFKNVIKEVSSIDSSATIQMESYLPNHIQYTSNSQKDGLVVFSEVYYEDGWVAYIDGKEVPYARANYILRALNIPKGKHTIDFKFEPAAFKISNIISAIGFLLLLIPFLVYVFLKFKSRKV